MTVADFSKVTCYIEAISMRRIPRQIMIYIPELKALIGEGVADKIS